MPDAWCRRPDGGHRGDPGLSRVVETEPELEETTMADDKIALRKLLEMSSGATFLREMWTIW
jgi:hypothetical protein